MVVTRPRLGVLGGSFDPPHLAHLAIASEAFHTLGLERVLFVPAAAPPHKVGCEGTPATTRLQLAALAVDDDLRFSVSSVEIERGLVYTVDTVRALLQRHSDHDLVFIMGSDSLLQLDAWHEPEELLALCTLAVAPRPGDAAAAVAAAAERWGPGRVLRLDAPAIDLSSTQIRERVSRRRPIRYLVPRPVEKFIHEAGLYR